MDQDVTARTRANELLHRLAIEDACLSGRRFYHVGESAQIRPLGRFKRGFGAEEAYHAHYRFERLPLRAANEFVRRRLKRVPRFRD